MVQFNNYNDTSNKRWMGPGQDYYEMRNKWDTDSLQFADYILWMEVNLIKQMKRVSLKFIAYIYEMTSSALCSLAKSI